MFCIGLLFPMKSITHSRGSRVQVLQLNRDIKISATHTFSALYTRKKRKEEEESVDGSGFPLEQAEGWAYLQ